MQNAALEWIASHAPELLAPRLIKTNAGDAQTEVALDGKPYTLRLLSWLDGSLWSGARIDPLESAWTLGRYLAKLDLALEHFEHAGAGRDFDWDLSRAERHLESLPMIDDEFRPLVQQVLLRFKNKIATPLAGCLRSETRWFAEAREPTETDVVRAHCENDCGDRLRPPRVTQRNSPPADRLLFVHPNTKDEQRHEAT